MATTYNFSSLLELKVIDRLTKRDDAGASDYRFQPGTGSMPSLKTILTSGSGANQSNALFRDYRGLAPGASDDFYLRGSSVTLADGFGRALAFTTLRRVLIAITDPDPGRKLTFGAAGNWSGWRDSGTAPETIHGITVHDNPDDGWNVNNNDWFRITNSGTSACRYAIELVGVF